MSVKFSLKYFFNSKKKLLIENKHQSLLFEGTNDALIVLIHGLTGTPNEVKFLAKYLNVQGFSVICPVLAGHGEPIEVLQRYRWQDFYASVKESLDNHLKTKSYKYIFASGLSLGALMSLLLARDFTDKINGVSCLSPTLFYDGWNIPWSQKLLPIVSLTPLQYMLYFKEEPPYGIKNEKIRKLVHRYYAKAKLDNIDSVAQYGYPYMPVNLISELQRLVKFLSKKLVDISVPVQLIQARNDDMTSVKNSQFVYDKVSSQIKEIVLLENSYHVITADQERDKVAENINNFFKKLMSA